MKHSKPPSRFSQRKNDQNVNVGCLYRKLSFTLQSGQRLYGHVSPHHY